ncbi:UNVERIFIED_CONTAM: hypothetical protein PYX00_005626 [Menopon gallinae]|uniref:Uncharacterized protein n=1 Tax=Menopon gallinae TaxID=328185 RepID=A0AAW2HTM4_9NEOP
MCNVLLLFISAVILSESNGVLTMSKSSDIEDDVSSEEWNGSEPPFSGDLYGEDLQFVQKRSNPDMRRSTLDKNFMRFGRSGFFPGERCCKHRDLVGFSSNWPSAADPAVTSKRGTDSNFMRFGRGKGDFIRFGRGQDNFMRFGRTKDNFMRFGRGQDNFMRFGKANDNFMRFGRGQDNFMRFGKADDNFMRFGRGQDNFMRFGKADDNFMRFGRGQDNFMRFGRGQDNFMRFGRNDKENFIRFGRGGKDNFMRFGKSYESTTDLDPEEFFRSVRNENFMRFGKSVKGTGDGPVRIAKSTKSGTNFLRFGRDRDEDADKVEESEESDVSDDPIKGTVRRKRMAKDVAKTRFARSPEIAEEVPLSDGKFKRSAEEYLSKPNLLKFISLINTNHPEFDWENSKSHLVAPEDQKYKRKQAGFIRFG